MIRQEEGQPIEKAETFRLADFNFKRNSAFESVRKDCYFCSTDFDWSFHRLCSNPKNTSKISQNEKGDRRCALPWCPRSDEVEQIHMKM